MIGQQRLVKDDWSIALSSSGGDSESMHNQANQVQQYSYNTSIDTTNSIYYVLTRAGRYRAKHGLQF